MLNSNYANTQCEEIKADIEILYSNTSVEKEKTLVYLQALEEVISTLINYLEEKF